MKWTELTVFTTEQGIDAVCARFDMLGITQLSIVQGRLELEAFLKENEKYWDFADMDELCATEPCVKAYIANAGDNASLIQAVIGSFEELRKTDVGIDLGSLRLISRIMDDEDWANSWKVNYKPFNVGEKLLIRPSWIDDYDARGRLVISLDPGMAFGSGTHQTTRMCLEALEGNVKPESAVLDLGCGSGILAIAAMLLGAKSAVCVDIDPVAEKVVAENMRMNGIDPNACNVLVGDAVCNTDLQKKLYENRYDVITANIVASVIIALAPMIPALLKENGVFITSGIIADRLCEVRSALEGAGLRITNTNADSEWRQMTAVRK